MHTSTDACRMLDLDLVLVVASQGRTNGCMVSYRISLITIFFAARFSAATI